MTATPPYRDAHALCKGRGARWADFLACPHNRAALASLRQQLPGACLIHDGTAKVLIHPALAELVERWADARRGKQPSRGYVYLIRCCGRYKMGKSKHPQVRLDDLNTPYEPELVFVVESSDMHALEARLHEFHADKRAWREWFDLTEEEAAGAALLASEWA